MYTCSIFCSVGLNVCFLRLPYNIGRVTCCSMQQTHKACTHSRVMLDNNLLLYHFLYTRYMCAMTQPAFQRRSESNMTPNCTQIFLKKIKKKTEGGPNSTDAGELRLPDWPTYL